MNQKISIGNREIFEGFQKKGTSHNHGNSFETSWEWPEEIGKPPMSMRLKVKRLWVYDLSAYP
jgi:hypothetical protein